MFGAVPAWSRVRFVRLAADEKASTTCALPAECFEVLGGVPRTVPADRVACLRAQIVADVAAPTVDHVRFATRHGFAPDFCHGADPQSEGIAENLVGHSKFDLMVLEIPRQIVAGPPGK